VISVSVCLSVCLFVSPLAHLENHMSKFHEIFCACYLCTWLSLLPTAMRCASGFVDDVMFSHDRTNARESEMTSSLPGGGTSGRQTNERCSVEYRVAAPGAKSPVFRLHFVSTAIKMR